MTSRNMGDKNRCLRLFKTSLNYIESQGIEGAYPPVEGAIPNAMTTAEVISALAEIDARDTHKKVVTNGVIHLKRWQREGGYLTDPNDTEPWDVSSTSWSIWALAASGVNSNSEQIRCARNWLRKGIMPDGGLPTNTRGEESNTYATSYTLRAFHRIGEKKLASQCLRFILSAQNKDGGWGLRTHEASEATLTGYALHGLLDGGTDINSKIFRSGMDWLIKDKKENGAWGSWLDERYSTEGTAFSLYILGRAGRLNSIDITPSLHFLAEKLDDGSLWSINGRNQIWVAISVLLASNSILSLLKKG